MGVGGPIVFVGGVMFGFAGAAFGVGAGAAGTVAFGELGCAGAVVVAGGAVGAGGGVVARVRCAATQVAQLKIVISRMNCFIIGILFSSTSESARCDAVILKSQTPRKGALSGESRSTCFPTRYKPNALQA